MKTLNIDEWQAVLDGDTLEFDGLEPTVLLVRSFGAAAVYLDMGAEPGLLVGVGNSEEFEVRLQLLEPHKLKIALEAVDHPASFRARAIRHTQPPSSPDDPWTIIKPRVRQSDEMRTMLYLLRQQEERHTRQLTELANAGSLPSRADVSGGAGTALAGDPGVDPSGSAVASDPAPDPVGGAGA